MSRLTGVILLICLYIGIVNAGMECSVGKKNSILNQVADAISLTCPRPLIDSSDQSFCCFDIQRDTYYCCDAQEFGSTILVPVLIGVGVILGLIVGCVCCLCCSCCPWYRRRHRGTVYGKVQSPIVQVIQPQMNLPPSYPSQSAESNYIPPTHSTGMAQPPPYTNEAYTKQAPYNPAFPAP